MIRRIRPLDVSTVLVGALVLAVALGATGCGPNSRQRAAASTLHALDATADTFATWDAEHQAAIVHAATSQEDGHAKLEAYRADRRAVELAFVAAYRAVADVALSAGHVDLVELGAAAAAAYRAVAQLEHGGSP